MTDDPGQYLPFPYNQLDAMMARPGLDEAMRASVHGAVAYQAAAPIMHRNLKDISRFMLGLVVLYLDGSGGLTHRRLRDLSGQSGILSAGTATAVLLRLQLIGYVTRADAPKGLARLYTPTAEMRAAFRERMRIEFKALTPLSPAAAAIAERLDEPDIFAALMGVMGELTIQAAGAPHEDIGVLNQLALRSAGLLILFDVMVQADQGGPFPTEGEVVASIAALARRYEVSRSHVLTVLRELEAAGFLIRGGREGAWIITPALSQAIRIFYGVSYLGLIRAAERVLAQLSAATAQGK